MCKTVDQNFGPKGAKKCRINVPENHRSESRHTRLSGLRLRTRVRRSVRKSVRKRTLLTDHRQIPKQCCVHKISNSLRTTERVRAAGLTNERNMLRTQEIMLRTQDFR